MTATQALMGGILKVLNLSEIVLVYLADRLYLSVVVTKLVTTTDKCAIFVVSNTNDKYCTFGQVQGL